VVVQLRRVDANHPRIPRLDDLAQAGPLPVVVGFLECEKAVVVEASDREVLDAFLAAAIEEHEDRPAP